MKLLVNAPTGAQELIEVGAGGGYFDLARVLWDERTDGELPEITLGSMTRVNGALVVDVARKAQHDAALAPKVPVSVTKRQGMAELIDRDLLAGIQGVLDGMASKPGDLARNDFANSQEWRRTWPLIEQMRQVFGWTDAFVDELFISAGNR